VNRREFLKSGLGGLFGALLARLVPVEELEAEPCIWRYAEDQPPDMRVLLDGEDVSDICTGMYAHRDARRPISGIAQLLTGVIRDKSIDGFDVVGFRIDDHGDAVIEDRRGIVEWEYR